MLKIKLSEYCKKSGIAYITGYRWFKEGKLPVKASQTISGTILVEVEDNEESMDKNNNETISSFLKKTVEYSNNNATVADFAAFVLSNFQLKLNSQSVSNAQSLDKYSKLKPSQETINEHFQNFINKSEKPLTQSFIPSNYAGTQSVGSVVTNCSAYTDGLSTTTFSFNDKESLPNDLYSSALNSKHSAVNLICGPKTYDEVESTALFSRVDSETKEIEPAVVFTPTPKENAAMDKINNNEFTPPKKSGRKSTK